MNRDAPQARRNREPLERRGLRARCLVAAVVLASFLAAGVFAYHCAFHPLLMHGKIRMPLRVSSSGTTVGQAIGLTAAEDAVPAGLTFDYQRQAPGGRWTTFRSGITKTRIRFVPKKAGTYHFRSRVPKSGRASGWSPAQAVDVAAG